MKSNNFFIVEPDVSSITRQLQQPVKYDELSEDRILEPLQRKRVSDQAYTEYRQGLVSACADAVVFTNKPDGKWLVLLSKRQNNKPFGGKWWIHGGAMHAYRSIGEFLTERIHQECGCVPELGAFVAVTYTSAPDHMASTIQPCYLATVPYNTALRATVDKDHTETRLFSLEEYRNLPADEQHWYIEGVLLATFEALKRWR